MSRPLPIDFAHLRRYTAGDAGLEREILDDFLASAEGYLAAMAEGGAGWRFGAHSLKGAARGIGAIRVAAASEAAEAAPGEAAARAAALAEIREAVAELGRFLASR